MFGFDGVRSPWSKRAQALKKQRLSDLASEVMYANSEQDACIPHPINSEGFNAHARLPYGLSIEHVHNAMQECLDFLGFINHKLHERGLKRLEMTLMPANFSSIIGELMVVGIAQHCSTLVKNRYHNGYPDLIPKGVFPNDSVQYGNHGIEVKASRYSRGWQGHNAESGWLMVIIFDSNRPLDAESSAQLKKFRFVKILAAELQREDWTFSGRSAASRRTITASINRSGYEKLANNWIYQDPL